MRNYFEGSYEGRRVAIPIGQIQGIMENTETTTIIYVTGYATDYFIVEGSYDNIVKCLYS